MSEYRQPAFDEDPRPARNSATHERKVWIPEESHDPPRRYDWQTDLQSDRRCRYKGCGRRAVAKLLRSNGWWYYCERHLYGRRIVGTTIERQVALGSPAHTAAVYWKAAGLDDPNV